MEDILLTPEQVASRLQVADQTVYNLLRRGQLRGFRIGRLWRVKPADLETFLSSASNEHAWQERWDALLTRIRRRTPTNLTEEEIDAEIAAACDEARELIYARSR